MKGYLALLTMAVLVVATAGCDGDGASPNIANPTPIATAGSSAASPSVRIQPSSIRAEPVSQPRCPVIPPFVGSLDVRVEAVDFPLSVNLVNMTFTDTTGLMAPAVTLPAPVLTRQFGSTLVEARSVRSFPVRFPFGCDTRSTGAITVVVVVSDTNGRETTREVRVPVQ
jgi:hypothetical protein